MGQKNAKTYEDNYLNVDKFDELNILIRDINQKKYTNNPKQKNKSTPNTLKTPKFKDEKNKFDTTAFSNRIDVFHQIFENGLINDSID